MKKIALFTISTLFSLAAFAQTMNMGGPTYLDIRHSSSITLPSIDVEELLREDALNATGKSAPFRFGFEHYLSYNIKDGKPIETDKGTYWTVEFNSPGALTMNFIFDQFHLPKGASVYLKSDSDVLGAYTFYNNNTERVLGTEILHGDRVAIEYFEPRGAAFEGSLVIGQAIHGYKPLGASISSVLRGLNDSGDCNVDVNCPLGDDWQDQINSVSLILAGGGLCSGALINNTEEDGTPYYLTANHCLGGSVAGWVFRFNWESPTPSCATTDPSQDPGGPYNSINGSVLRASKSSSDFALLELNSRPHVTWDVHYNGWDNSGSAYSNATGIHHPSGDVKKICREDQSPQATSSGGVFVWRIANWDQGVTEGGSSGSPLFDEDKRIVGQLFGGAAACVGTNDNNQFDNYGRFDQSWNGNTPSTRLRDWLDPSASGVATIDGVTPPGPQPIDAGIVSISNIPAEMCNDFTLTPIVEIYNHGTQALSSATIYYSVDGGAAQSYNWTGNLPSYTSESVLLPEITSTEGEHFFTAYTEQPNGTTDGNLLNDNKTYYFEMTTDPTADNVTVSISTDNFGSETTWEITLDGDEIATGGPYPDGFPASFEEVLCLTEDCYVFRIYDGQNNGMEDGVGNYVISDASGNDLVLMPNASFGGFKVHQFCVAPVSAQYLEADSDLMKVVPNPASDEISIQLEFTPDRNAYIQLFNSTGQLVQTSNISTSSKMIDISSQASGMYIVKLTTGDRIMTQRLVKIK